MYIGKTIQNVFLDMCIGRALDKESDVDKPEFESGEHGGIAAKFESHLRKVGLQLLPVPTVFFRVLDTL
jgi:hypothetical protein